MNAEHLLMTYSERAWCGDCGTDTIHLPVEGESGCWCCTACDAATVTLSAPVPTAA